MVCKKVCVIGLGYIGLPTAALLANRNYVVHGVDVQEHVVNTINRGEIHIVEPELYTFVKLAVQSGNLRASLVPDYADVFIIAVPTPFHENHVPNIDYVISATKSIIKYIKPGNIIILESTSPVGTTYKMEQILKEGGVDVNSIYIAYCPERVLPGYIMKELIENDRIVGGNTAKASQLVKDFYTTFVSGEIMITDSRTAEMAKLVENSYRDVNIAFANELSILCDKFQINVWELIKLTNHHPRVKILQPSAGVGGHCIAVDPWFIVHAGGEDAKLIKQARLVNNGKTEWVFRKIKSLASDFENKNNRKPVIACMGLAFKPNIDDLRESPALDITTKLINENYSIIAVEPNISHHTKVKIVAIEEAIVKADIVVFLVAHEQFKNLSLVGKIVFDICGINQ